MASLVSGYLMRFVIAGNLLGLPAISVPVSNFLFSWIHNLVMVTLVEQLSTISCCAFVRQVIQSTLMLASETILLKTSSFEAI